MAETKKKSSTKDTLIIKTLAKILENQKKMMEIFNTLNENICTVAEIVDELNTKGE